MAQIVVVNDFFSVMSKRCVASAQHPLTPVDNFPSSADELRVRRAWIVAETVVSRITARWHAVAALPIRHVRRSPSDEALLIEAIVTDDSS